MIDRLVQKSMFAFIMIKFFIKYIVLKVNFILTMIKIFIFRLKCYK